MLAANTNHIPVAVSVGPLSRKNSSNSHVTTGALSRKNSSNSYASFDGLSRKKGLAGQQSPTGTIPFPWKLHRILDEADIKGFNDVISWVTPDGITPNGFKVHKTKVFDEDIMPKYFDKTKYKSFQRQLNMWGFDRVGSGPYKGAYMHTCFIRGQPELCKDMQRTKIKGIHSKKLRKKNDMLGGSNHSTGDPLGRGSNHSSSSTSSRLSDIGIHASLRRAAEKVADLEQQKEEIQRKLDLLSTQANSVNMGSHIQPSLPEDDAFQPLPLSRGDSLVFGGHNFYFHQDGKFSDKSSNQQRRRAGRRYSLELKGPDSDEYILKELQGDLFTIGMPDGSNHTTNSRSNQSLSFDADFMSPTPLGPDGLDVIKASANIPDCDSSLSIGLDKTTRRFSLLSTPVHNPYEKTNQKPPRPHAIQNMGTMNANNNMMNMDIMTNNMMNMRMNMKTFGDNPRNNGFANLLTMMNR